MNAAIFRHYICSACFYITNTFTAILSTTMRWQPYFIITVHKRSLLPVFCSTHPFNVILFTTLLFILRSEAEEETQLGMEKTSCEKWVGLNCTGYWVWSTVWTYMSVAADGIFILYLLIYIYMYVYIFAIVTGPIGWMEKRSEWLPRRRRHMTHGGDAQGSRGSRPEDRCLI